jgi:hypothetical protein
MNGLDHVRHGSFSTFVSRWSKGKAVRAKKQGSRRVAEYERSSVVIPNKEEEDLYFLSGENRKGKRDENSILTTANSDDYNSRSFVQRKREEGGVPGNIDIMVRMSHLISSYFFEPRSNGAFVHCM